MRSRSGSEPRRGCRERHLLRAETGETGAPAVRTGANKQEGRENKTDSAGRLLSHACSHSNLPAAAADGSGWRRWGGWRGLGCCDGRWWMARGREGKRGRDGQEMRWARRVRHAQQRMSRGRNRAGGGVAGGWVVCVAWMDAEREVGQSRSPKQLAHETAETATRQHRMAGSRGDMA